MGLIWNLIRGNSKNSELENEMNNDNLEEWQKKLVHNGEYDKDSFEEDGELEEDDYYYEDDE